MEKTLENIIQQTVNYSVAIIVGELLYRLLMLVEKFAMSGRVYRDTIFCKGQVQVFFPGVLLLLLLAVLIRLYLITTRSQSFQSSDLKADVKMFVKTGVAWVIVRSYRIVDNCLESADILDENNACMGPGLASSYLYGFLNPVLDSRDRIDVEVSERFGRFRRYDKLLILIPTACELNVETYHEEGVYKCVPSRGPPDLPCSCHYCQPQRDLQELPDTCKCGASHHQVLGRLSSYREDIKRTVYWIFEHAEDERRYKADQLDNHLEAAKIFLVMDFPLILRTATRPRNGLREKREVKRTLNMFVDTIKKYLDHDRNRKEKKICTPIRAYQDSH